MIIYLYGSDDWRREEKKKEIIKEFQNKHSSLGLDFFDLASEGESSRFENFVKSQSLFETAKLAVVWGTYGNPSQEFIGELKLLEEVSSTTVLISEIDEPPKELGKKILTQKFEYLRGSSWGAFIEAEAKKRGVKLTSRALSFLVFVYEGDTWRFMTELEKISSLPRPLIDRADLENLGLEITPNFWELFSGLKSRNIKQRLTSLETIFSQNEPAGKIFNILAYQWPEGLGAFADYDLLVKSGKLDYEEAFVDLAIR